MNKETQRVMFSSEKEDWGTPFDLFKQLNEEFHFTTDPCTTADNPLGCFRFYTKEENGQDWNVWLGNVFINPPYGPGIGDWLAEAQFYTQEMQKGTVVFLLPARTDTAWFHDFCYQKPNVEIRFLRGRLKFRGSKNSAPFPSMLVIFRAKP